MLPFLLTNRFREHVFFGVARKLHKNASRFIDGPKMFFWDVQEIAKMVVLLFFVQFGAVQKYVIYFKLCRS